MGRSVFLTGHTGFKGAWLTAWLTLLGARVHGYAGPPPSQPSLFNLATAKMGTTTFGDVRDLAALQGAMAAAQPTIVFHLAAQALVRCAYDNPVETYATNVMGTVHVLEAIRQVPSVRAAVIVTSDKCYENLETGAAFREDDRLGGRDPYSNSKACCELVTAAYRSSFFAGERRCAIASARAGNVIGGGDWSADRLVPDLERARVRGEVITVRSPHAVRPWQHVLEPLQGYLRLGEALLSPDGAAFATSWNFGPSGGDCVPVVRIVKLLARLWDVPWRTTMETGVHEAGLLKIDSSKARIRLGWAPRLNVEQAVAWTASEYTDLRGTADPITMLYGQIGRYTDCR